ncbi:kinase-like domain-containing protein [Xylaria bambusicola]|uniref:kinase-like domain-containing protein n=1 Tax=Xylaria bambusicola TaxID=326684 RepID=UPI0020087043|nr:kinase-like domain-containing protein [Xylaria bambusicola]KAI0521418.1 kinase-like domain-containing protein [Xylaria bambusicola]
MASVLYEDGQPDHKPIAEANTNHSKIPHKQKYIELYGVEDVEEVEDYRENGFHPVDILDILDGRFEVCHKLGSGGIATVWLCYEAGRQRWRAIKINAASHSSMDSAELRIGKLLEKQGFTPQELEKHHIVIAEETFWIEGPNGRHLCSVLPVFGPSLPQWRELAVGWGASKIQEICYEIVQGLHFLHEHEICHGDFRPQNILMRLADGGLDHLDPDDLFAIISLPSRHKVLTLDGERSLNAPKWVTEPLNWYELKDLVLDGVSIVDFGEAFETTSPPSFLGIPGTYASPEVAYGGESLGKGIDIWSLALTLMETRTGRKLGDIPNSPLDRMENFAGPIPPPYRSAAAEEIYRNQLDEFRRYGPEEMKKPQPPSEKILESTSSLTDMMWETSGGGSVSTSLSPDGIEKELRNELWECVLVPQETDTGEEITAEMRPYQLSEHEVAALKDLLTGMLKYRPSDRRSTSDVLRHSWFKKDFDNEESDAKEPAEQLVGFTSNSAPLTISEGADTTKLKTDEQDNRTARGNWSRYLFPVSQNKKLFVLSFCLPIMFSFLLLWYMGLSSDRVTIRNLEVFSIELGPTQPGTHAGK